MDASSYISSGASLVALGLSVLSLRRSATKEDSEATDKRISLKLGSDIAVIKNEVQNISKTLTLNAELVRNTVNATTNAITEAAEMMLKIRG